MAGSVVSLEEVLTRMGRIPPKKKAVQKMDPDEPYIPKTKPDESSDRGTAERVSIQFWAPPRVVERFDAYWQSLGIASRTQALVWLMDDAVRSDRRPPKLVAEDAEEMPTLNAQPKSGQ